MNHTFAELQEIFDADLTAKEFGIKVSMWKMNTERELQQLDIMVWLEENHPFGKQCFTKQARLIETLAIFRDEILGVNQ